MKRVFAALDWFFASVFSVVMGIALIYSIFQPSITQKKPAAERQAANAAPRHNDLLLLDAVQKVNTEISMLMISPYFALAMDEPAPCILAREMHDGPKFKDAVMAKVAAEFTDKCALTHFSRKLTLPVFEKIAATNSLPPKMFTFEVFHEDQWQVVGIFDSDDSCNSVRGEASKHGSGTKACVAWHATY